MTEKKLASLCEVWKKRLRVQDWNTTVNFSPYIDVQGDGSTNYHFDLKSARILICDEATYCSSHFPVYDPEQILVHELVHLMWAKLDRHKIGSEKYSLLETAVDHTATALVNAYRGVK